MFRKVFTSVLEKINVLIFKYLTKIHMKIKECPPVTFSFENIFGCWVHNKRTSANHFTFQHVNNTWENNLKKRNLSECSPDIYAGDHVRSKISYEELTLVPSEIGTIQCDECSDLLKPSLTGITYNRVGLLLRSVYQITCLKWLFWNI